MKYSIFGESHGPAIGVVLEGVPAGLNLDLDAIRFDLARRFLSLRVSEDNFLRFCAFLILLVTAFCSPFYALL